FQHAQGAFSQLGQRVPVLGRPGVLRERVHATAEVDLRIGLRSGLELAHLRDRDRLRRARSAEVVLRRVLRRLGRRLIGLPGDGALRVDGQGRAGRRSRVRRILARRLELLGGGGAAHQQRRENSGWHDLSLLWRSGHSFARAGPPGSRRPRSGRDEGLAGARCPAPRARTVATTAVAATVTALTVAVSCSPCVNASRAAARSADPACSGSCAATARAPPSVARAASAASGATPGGMASAMALPYSAAPNVPSRAITTPP